MTPMIPTKTLFGAVVLGAAYLAASKLFGGAKKVADLGASASGRGRSALRSVRAAANAARTPKAPYSSGLTTSEGADRGGIGMPASVASAKQAHALGEPFSAGLVTDVLPSARDKGGLADGGR